MRRKMMYLMGGFRLLKEFLWSGGKLKLSGYKYYLGKNVKINTENGGKCYLGKKTWLSDNTYFSANGGDIVLGYNNFFNSNCKLVAKAGITVGDNNLFGPNVVAFDNDHNYENLEMLICKQGYTVAKIEIGSDIWIGANVTICKGVRICDHVVVGANSVVTKSITEPGVYAGVPARKIKSI